MNNLRKGCQYLHEIINTFAEKIGHERINVLLLFAGGQDEDFEKKFNVSFLNNKEIKDKTLNFVKVESDNEETPSQDWFVPGKYLK